MVDFEIAIHNSRYNQLSHLHFCFNSFKPISCYIHSSPVNIQDLGKDSLNYETMEFLWLGSLDTLGYGDAGSCIQIINLVPLGRERHLNV